VRNLIAVILWASLAVHAAPQPQTIDLDKPGALETLRKSKPEHYAKVVESMEKVQAVPISAQGQQDLRLEVRKPDPTRRQIETSHPAKTRMTIPIDETQYRITVTYTKDPATVVPAK
jgi:hypothetical protein